MIGYLSKTYGYVLMLSGGPAGFSNPAGAWKRNVMCLRRELW
ncbi:Uncharacterized protein dnm_085550 [Desulfonema magnum]|uniref:Uncharacterized protein n=1 Tax=Desulfonema magnum TaxID=45655 RepID=A0A975GSW2_9BACT|nr:Uncharacterized protein dnm_085550 [Desulfonema magnum]